MTLHLLALIAVVAISDGHEPLPVFERVVIDSDFPSAYQVELADVDGDGKADLVAVGGGTCAWYHNPDWNKRVVTTPERTPGIISSATADLDGDGRAEVAIAYEFAMNQPKKGRLGLAIPGPNFDQPWRFRPIAEIGSIHRLRWGDFTGDGKQELVVAPILGRTAEGPTYDQSAVVVTLFRTGDDPVNGRWTAFPFGPPRKVLHAIDMVAGEHADGNTMLANLLTADREGVSLVTPKISPNGEIMGESTLIAPGVEGDPPKVGASEVHRGRLADGGIFIATINPWHGDRVLVHSLGAAGLATGSVMIDDTLAEGHALCVADVDGDGDDEIFAGHRGADYRVSAFDFDGTDWKRTVLDREVAAQDLRAGDIDGDGRPEVVTVGGSTKNVILYRFVR
jgi:Aldos-2-ulose dehydratase, beta-propeller domain/FG-GAP-like repeat